jgi:hypothetical protein
MALLGPSLARSGLGCKVIVQGTRFEGPVCVPKVDSLASPFLIQFHTPRIAFWRH